MFIQMKSFNFQAFLQMMYRDRSRQENVFKWKL